MNTSFFRLSMFLSESAYNKLKTYFIEKDLYLMDRTPRQATGEENPEITYKFSEYQWNGEYDEETVIDVKNIYFIDDFLQQGFTDLIKNEILDFERYCFEKGLSTKSLRSGHLVQLEKKFSKSEEIIQNATYLPEKVKTELLKSLKEVIKSISREIGVTYLKIPKKLKIKLPKNQIEALFFILWKNKKIQATSPSEIGSVLDFLFEYQDEKGKFHDVYNSRKEIADFQSGKGIKAPLEKLMSFFTNPDTYKI